MNLDFNALQNPTVYQTFGFKPAIRFLDLANIQTKEAIQSRKIFSRSNSLLSLMDVPNKMSKLGKSVVLLGCYRSLGECVEIIIDIFKKFTSIIGIFISGILIAHQDGKIFLSNYQLSILDAVGFLGSLALFLKSMTEVRKNFNQLMSSRIGEYAFNLALLKVIGRICGIVTGIFGMITFAFGGGIQAKWVLLGVSTLALFISISKFYLKSLYSE